jgi:excisionase family DNA binding protein
MTGQHASRVCSADLSAHHAGMTRPQLHRTEPLALRTPEAAQLLRISERLLAELTRKGKIPSLTINRARLYRVEALNEWLKAREQGGEQ